MPSETSPLEPDRTEHSSRPRLPPSDDVRIDSSSVAARLQAHRYVRANQSQ